jgi:hypothetical protein
VLPSRHSAHVLLTAHFAPRTVVLAVLLENHLPLSTEGGPGSSQEFLEGEEGVVVAEVLDLGGEVEGLFEEEAKGGEASFGGDYELSFELVAAEDHGVLH